MFVDEVLIKVMGGLGGDGCTSFKREKYIPLGGPDGGNGGKGSSIIFRADEGLKTLLDLRYNKIIKGNKGNNGQGSNKYGKGAEDIYIKVPTGTTVIDNDTGLILADLTDKGQEVVVAHGGRGGRGNRAFINATNKAPNISEFGEPGEIRNLKVSLKLLADVGLVGMPSVGKSTILSMISASKPKIAEYHFTTLVPNLGVVGTIDGRTFVVADLPGLIEGASHGEGLGDEFLKHIERTRVIAHIIDMSAYEGRDPYEDYVLINKELEDYNPKLMKKPQIVIANKMDMESSKQNLIDFKKKVKNIEIFEVSAIMNKGLDKAMLKLADMLDIIDAAPIYEEDEFESHVLYKFKKEHQFHISKDDNVYTVKGAEIEKLLNMTKFASDEAALRFGKILKKMGIDEELVKMGIEEGNTVRILGFEFEYKE